MVLFWVTSCYAHRSINRCEYRDRDSGASKLFIYINNTLYLYILITAVYAQLPSYVSHTILYRIVDVDTLAAHKRYSTASFAAVSSYGSAASTSHFVTTLCKAPFP